MDNQTINCRCGWERRNNELDLIGVALVPAKSGEC